MHRRRFLTLLTTLVVVPQVVAARQFDVETTPPPDAHAPAWMGIRYEATDQDAPIRSIEVRLSYWDDPVRAGAAAGALTANAGTPLPEGEFYHSEVTTWTPQLDDIEADEISGQEWLTTVGVAAYQTFYAQVVVWQSRKVTVVLVSGSSAEVVQQEAARVATLTLTLVAIPCGPTPDPLPTVDEVPAGMTVVWRADETGPVDDGTPGADRRQQAECTQIGKPTG